MGEFLRNRRGTADRPLVLPNQSRFLLQTVFDCHHSVTRFSGCFVLLATEPIVHSTFPEGN